MSVRRITCTFRFQWSGLEPAYTSPIHKLHTKGNTGVITKNLKPEPTAFFWGLAAPLLASGEATEGALMGFPCLRVDGEFFATCDHRTGELIVKLPRDRVQELIEQVFVVLGPGRRLGMVLDSNQREVPMAQPLHRAVV